MATLLDAQARLLDEARAVQVEGQRAFGEVAQHVQLGQRGGGFLQRRQMADQQFQQFFVELLFTSEGAAFGRQRLVLEFLELRRDETLGAFERLPADVVGRRGFGLLARQFDEVAVHAVVADLEVGQARTRLLARLQVHQVLAGVFGERLQFVQLGVVAGLQDAAVADHRRRIVDDRLGQQIGQFGVGADARGQFDQVRCDQLLHARL